MSQRQGGPPQAKARLIHCIQLLLVYLSEGKKQQEAVDGCSHLQVCRLLERV